MKGGSLCTLGRRKAWAPPNPSSQVHAERYLLGVDLRHDVDPDRTTVRTLPNAGAVATRPPPPIRLFGGRPRRWWPVESHVLTRGGRRFGP